MAEQADTSWAIGAPTTVGAVRTDDDNAGGTGEGTDRTPSAGEAPDIAHADLEPADGAPAATRRAALLTAAPDLPTADPRWARPALLGLLAVTAAGWLWNLDRNGWGNTFYAAAVQAGTQSWKAFFFGSFDAANFITVDKPPVSLWMMAVSGRIFGFSSWSMLAPEVLLGVGSVALLYLAVRRVWGAPAGLLAAAALATTPVAALMFRFDNPDATLTFLLVATGYAMTRAVEDGRWRWLLGCAVLLGTAFLTKSLQSLLVLPGLALAYLVAAPGGIGRRVGRLLVAGVVLAVSGLWWFVAVDAIPAADRPYAGGSTSNSTLALALGSNGLGRLLGTEGGGPGGAPRGGPTLAPGSLTGGPGPQPGTAAGGPLTTFGGPGGNGSFGGATGLDRLVNPSFGGEIGWLLPAAIVALLVGLWLTRRTPRTDPRRAGLLLWGGWLVATAGVLSFMSGIVHTYYAVALAPAVAALAGMLLPALWRARARVGARLVLALMLAVTAAMAFVLLGRAGEWLPWLRWAVVATAAVAAAGLLVVRTSSSRSGRLVAAAVAGLALASALAAPLAWSLQTIGTTHTGSLPVSGPAAAAAGDGAGVRGGGFGGGPGGPAGPDGPDSADPALVALVGQDAARYTWVAAASSSMTAGPVQLATGHPVMSLGGFGGQDPAITLDGFRTLVATGKVHYYIGDGGGGGFGGGRRGPGGGATSEIAQWVASTFTATTVGGTTVYDLTSGATSGA